MLILIKNKNFIRRYIISLRMPLSILEIYWNGTQKLATIVGKFPKFFTMAMHLLVVLYWKENYLVTEKEPKQ